MKTLLKGVLLATALLASGPALAKSGDCNRACLSGKLDQFLKAVVAHDPARAGLWAGVRQTQNTIVTPPGEGIWKTITALGTVDGRYFDPVTGQAEFFGTVQEDDKTGIASLRLKVERGQVTEAEWHIARAGDPGITGDTTKSVFNSDNLIANPPPRRTVPVAQRTSREELIAAVNSYFDGIVTGTGRWVQANPGCFRLENGTDAPGPHTNRPVSGADAEFQTSSDCRSNYAGLNIVNVAARRYLMVDEEAQVVVASAVFIRDPLSPKRRNHFMEVFFMDGGKISSVYAAMVYADPKLPMPNWAPYEGNFQIGQTLIQQR